MEEIKGIKVFKWHARGKIAQQLHSSSAFP
jgi:hypothetical protein